ncbi:transcriptional regulator, TrmB (plasmid) [halophilic archaeon DL31]|jgi:sugar-specific transcriptional regulator TrmB|nr:transcriptional regulator, TrmB [halophilic archaeon DL31]
MVPDPIDDPRSTAVEQLEQFGLSSYAAQTFVALVTLGVGTAKEVSQVSAVPRTRVYDAVEELRDHGLVDVKQSSSKEFWAISGDSTGRKFEREMNHRTTVLTEALDQLEPVKRSEEQQGVWTVNGQEPVTDRPSSGDSHLGVRGDEQPRGGPQSDLHVAIMQFRDNRVTTDS